MRPSSPTMLVPYLMIAAHLAAACSENAGPTGEVDLDQYVATLPTWDVYSPLLASLDTVAGDTLYHQELVHQILNGVEQDVTYACAATPHSLIATPDQIVMYEPNASIMWVGNLIQGRSYKGGLGAFQELSIRQRAPLRLSIDLLTGNNAAIVEHPSLTTVQAAIGDLIQRAQDAGHRAGSSISYNSHESHALRQAALNLGMSADWLGGSASATLEVQRDASQHTLIAHFVQKMFTIAIELPQSPSAFFSRDFTRDLLREQIDAGNIGSENLPVYIANITYGRTLTYSLTSSYNEDRMRAAIAASFDGFIGGGSGYSEQELQQTLSQDNIRVVAIGGEGQNVLDLVSQGNLKTYFATDAPLTTARPISYQLNYLGDNKLTRVSETTSYLLEDCAQVPPNDVVSDFETDNESWKVENGSTTDAIRSSRGPYQGDWYISAQDGTGGITYLRAPAKFRGDKAAYYGGNLSYGLRWFSRNSDNSGAPLAANDVILVGANGTTITYRFGIDSWKEDQWAFRQVALDTTAQWRVGNHLASEQQIRDVLANLIQFKLRAEYRTDAFAAPDVGSVDMVVLSKNPVAVSRITP